MNDFPQSMYITTTDTSGGTDRRDVHRVCHRLRARIAAICAAGIFMITRHGRDVIMPRFTEMNVVFDRTVTLNAAN